MNNPSKLVFCKMHNKIVNNDSGFTKQNKINVHSVKQCSFFILYGGQSLWYIYGLETVWIVNVNVKCCIYVT